MKRHDFSSRIGKQKKVTRRHLQEISRSILNSSFILSSHQRLDVREIRCNFRRLREHSLALLCELLKSQNGTVQLFINLTACMLAQILLHDQEAGARERGSSEDERKEKFRTQANFDHRCC